MDNAELRSILLRLGPTKYIRCKKDKEAIPRLTEELEKYCREIDKEYSKLSHITENVKNNILKCVEYYLSGNLLKATQTMQNLLSDLNSEGKDYLYIHNMDASKYGNIQKYMKTELFKGRKKQKNKSFSQRDMLHIRFDEREIIRTNRFSIPGVPCLYLGSSIYVVWEELDRMSMDDLCISKYKMEAPFKILDLTLGQYSILALINEVFKEGAHSNTTSTFIFENIFEKYLLTNLFKIACTIYVEQTERGFKSEYIVPQLLLQGIINLGIADGVRYSSVKSLHANEIAINYAFPAIKDSSDPYSWKIVEGFKATAPVNLGLLDMTRLEMNYGKVDIEYTSRNKNEVMLASGLIVNYDTTKFYLYEDYIKSKLPFREIKIN